MKIVIIHRYFWPDTPPLAIMLRHIAKQLTQDKHNVTVISAQPSYKNDFHVASCPWVEELDGFTVKRLKLGPENRDSLLSRLFTMTKFSIKLFFELLRQKPDITTIATTPQIMGGLVVRLACKFTNSKYIYHCQDIYPEIAQANGFLKSRLIFNLLQIFDKKTCDQAFATVVLSEDMRLSLLNRGCCGNNIRVINNFELIASENNDSECKIDQKMVRGVDKFRILFAGNIGRFQGLETVIKAAHHLSHEKHIEFVFLGEGQSKKNLEKQSGILLGKTIHFFGHQSLPVARKIIADSQLCLISLNKNIYKYAYPSKTMTYMCEGVPVAVIIEPESELARTVRKRELGIIVKPEDADGLAKQISNLYSNQTTLSIMRKNVTNYADQYFRMNSVILKWSELIRENIK